MRKQKFCRSLVACMLSVLMILGTCATTFAAAEETTINYVSLGDSMTNGYGLEGYNGNNGVHDYGDASYANQFTDWLDVYSDGLDDNNVVHYPLAMSGMRAEDLHWFLELDHESEEIRNFLNDISSGWEWDEEEWYSVFNIGDYRTRDDMVSDRNRSSAAASNILATGYDSPYATQQQKDDADCLNDGTAPEGEGYVHYTNENQAAIVAEYYQTAIENADVISMAVGNSNFGTFMFDQIVNAVGYSGTHEDPMKFSIERALTECPPQIKEYILDLKDKLYVAVEDYLNIELDYDEAETEMEHTTAAIANAAVYAGISYVLNYAGSVDAILKLNPDVEIIQVGLMNTYLNTSGNVEASTIGSLLEVIFPPINAFIAALPTVMQAVGNELYKDATFYYAEAPEVACMVEVYGTDFYNEDGTCNRGSITRQRFFRDLMGLISGFVGDRDSFGAPLDYSLTFEELCSYDEMDDNEKAAYAYANTNKAVTCAVYLAFEKATVEAGKDAPVTLDSIMGLGNMDISQFSGVLVKLNEKMVTNVPLKFPATLNAIASVFNGAAYSRFTLVSELTGNDVYAVYTAGDADKLNTAKAVVQSIADDARNAAVIEGMADANLNDSVYASYYPAFAAQYSIPLTWDQFKVSGLPYYAQFVNSVRNGAIDTVKNTIIDESASILVDSMEYVEKLAKLLALPDSLGEAMAEDDKATSWFGLTGRCVIGDGLGGHPAPAGHDSLFEAVKTVYENEYTSKDETIKNIEALAEIVKGYILEYYDEAYALAYEKALENGYIDTAVGAIDEAIKAVEAIDVSGTQMTDEFKADLYAELDAIIATLGEIKAVLANDDAKDVEGLIAAITALEDDLNTHLALAGAMLEQAGFDAKTLLLPVIDAYVKEKLSIISPEDLKDKIDEFVGNLKAEADKFVEDLKAQLALKIAQVGHVHYEAEEGDYYVAIGGNTVSGKDISRDEYTYHDLLADELSVDKKAVYDASLPLLYTEISDLVMANAAEIAKADLITYQADASSFIYALLSETPDWDKYIDADTQALINDILAKTTEILTKDWEAYADSEIAEIVPEIKAEVLAYIPERVTFAESVIDNLLAECVSYVKAAVYRVADKKDAYVSKVESITENEMVMEYAEKLAFTTVAYAAETLKAVETIKAINPTAAVVVVGMYNPAKGLEIVIDGETIDAEEIFEYVIDATNLYYAGVAAAKGGFAFVDVSDAETAGFNAVIDADVMSVQQIGTMLLSASAKMHANAAGHEYIKDQILKAFVCDYSVYEAKDAEYHYVKCAICGHAFEEAHEFGDDDLCDKCGYDRFVPTPEPTATPEPTPAPTRRPSSGGGVVSNKFTVTFDSNGGSKVASASVKKGEVVAEPVAPTKAGFVFDGWYTDKALTAKYDFATPVTKSFTLYAKWVDAFGLFTDLDANAWYYEYVKAAVEKGLMNGVSKTEFAPNATLTRSMFVTILYRAEETPEIKAENKFTDVAAGQYYADAVAWANANGIVLGITDTEFAPNAEITREQMAAIIARYAEYKKVSVPELDAAEYTDGAEIADYAKDAVDDAKALGILIGNSDGTFAPKANATRAQAAALFVRLLEVLAK